MSNINDFVIENGVLKKYTGKDADVVIPEGVTKIGNSAFSNCKRIESIVVPKGVTKIGKYAFYGCENLSLVELPSGISCIDNAALCNLHAPVTFIMPRTTAQKLDRRNLTDLFGTDDFYRVFLKVKVKSTTACVFLVSKYSDYNPKFFLDESNPDMAAYDSFVKTDNRYRTGEIIYAAFARLTYPFKLEKEAETFYEEFLDKNLKKAVTAACENNNTAWLQMMLDRKIINTSNFKKLSTTVYSASVDIVDLFATTKIPEINAETKTPGNNTAAKKADKSAAVKHPIEDFCKENFNEKDLNAIVKKSIPFANRLENVKYKGGSGKASEFVVKCAIVPYIAQMESRPKQIGDYKKDFIETRVDHRADKVAEVLDPKSFTDMLEKIAKEADYKLPQCFIPLCRFGTPDQMKTAISKMKEWTDWYTYGSSGRSAIIVLRGALMLSDHPAAVQLAEKGGYFRQFANVRGFTEQEYRDEKSLPDLGFDADGVKTYEADGKKYEVRIGANLTLELTQDGKTVKSIAKKTPEGEAAAADFAAMKKEFTDFVKKRTEYIKSIYINGETIAADSWLKAYGSKQLLLPFAERVIWQNGANVFFEVTNGKIRDINGNEFTPSEPVRIAHVLDMTKEEIEQWQTRIVALKKTLLIEQVWEPVVALKKSTDICTRYEGSVLTKEERNELKRVLKEKAINVKSEEQGYDIYRRSYGYSENTMVIGGTIRLDYVFDEATNNTTLGKMNKQKLYRKTNTVFFELDRLCTRHHITTDNVEALNESILCRFTLAQITEFVDLAVECNSTNCTALLLDYRNKTFGEPDPFSMFVL